MRTEDLQEHRAPRAPTPNAVSDWGETELNNSPIGLFSNTSLPIDALSGVSPFLLRAYSSQIIILDPHFIAVIGSQSMFQFNPKVQGKKNSSLYYATQLLTTSSVWIILSNWWWFVVLQLSYEHHKLSAF